LTTAVTLITAKTLDFVGCYRFTAVSLKQVIGATDDETEEKKKEGI